MLALLILKPELKWYIELALWLVPYLVIGYDVLLSAARGLIHGQLLDENFLMAIATVGALAIAIWGRGDYTEAVAVMLFYQIGELFQSIALGKSRKSISALMDIRPDFARVERGGELFELSPEEVEIGEIIVVNPGERVAIDGVIESGESAIDCSALTGESLPSDVSVGDEVLSASVNLSSPLRIRTTKVYGESAVARILDLVENASSRKSKSEKFISKFAKIYTPAVCAAALLLALLPPLVLFATGRDANVGEWIYRALSFLVISCPCALVISIPMGFFASLGGAGKRGILVKGSNCLEALASIECVATDKTGTLTKGRFELREIEAVGIDEAKLLEYAAHPAKQYHSAVARGAVAHRHHPIGVLVGDVCCLAGEERLKSVPRLKCLSASLLALVEVDCDAVTVNLLLLARGDVTLDGGGGCVLGHLDGREEDRVGGREVATELGIALCLSSADIDERKERNNEKSLHLRYLNSYLCRQR